MCSAAIKGKTARRTGSLADSGDDHGPVVSGSGGIASTMKGYFVEAGEGFAARVDVIDGEVDGVCSNLSRLPPARSPRA
jgi:hypothetical protein